MAGNSTITLSQLCDDAATLGDVSPALSTGGFSDSPALSIANDVIVAMLLGGPEGQPFNWKFNRFNVPPFATISVQQDYFIPGLVTLGWLENGWATNVNQSSIPKQVVPLEVRRDLDVTYLQTGYPDKLCWIQCDQCQTGVWGQSPLGPTAANPSGQTSSIGPSGSGLLNPGANVLYTNPIGAISTPLNAATAITDPNGKLWVLTTYGTCGGTQPTWPMSPLYPTYQNPSTVATTVNDGTCVWTAINPQGQAIRLNPIPPISGTVWLIQPLGQRRVPTFTSLGQTLDPVPDDYASYFKQGFFCECYRRNPDNKVRSRYQQEYQRWMTSLDKAVRQGQREMDDYGFYPSSAGVMDTSYVNVARPDLPYGPY